MIGRVLEDMQQILAIFQKIRCQYCAKSDTHAYL